MSFPVTNSTGLRVTGLSVLNSSTFASGMFLGIYIKSGSDYCRGLQLYSDADGSAPNAGLGSQPSTRSPWMTMRTGITGSAVHAGDYANDAWALIWGKWNASTGDVTSGHGDMSGTTVSGDDGWESWGSASTKAIGVGVWRNDAGSADEFSVTISYKLALPFIAKRLPTSGELTSLAGGAHPYAVFGADLLDYWPPNSKTSALNGWVLSDVGGTITIDTGDNPTVDDPPSAGGVPKTTKLALLGVG